MKKYFLSLVAIAAAMLFATSCQESLVEPQMDGTTTFSIEIPTQMGTKADIGSAENVNQLLVEVYPAGKDNVIFQAVKPISGSTTVELNLIQDQAYDILFWAQKANEYVVVTDGAFTSLKTIALNCRNLNNDNGAAFFHAEKGFDDLGTSPTIKLKRPFAQLNLGTTDASLQPMTGTVALKSSLITVKGVATHFNVYEGAGYGEQDVEWVYGPDASPKAPVAVPTEPSKLTIGTEPNVQTFNYVSMNYLAVLGDAKAVVDVDAVIVVKETNGSEKVIEHSFANVPVQENYRTNIVGDLITSTTNFNVIVDEKWAGEDYDILTSNVIQKQIDEAIANATPGSTIEIEISSDVQISENPLRFGTPTKSGAAASEIKFILDLNGKTINADLVSEGRHLYAIENYADLTIKGPGTINARGNFNYGKLTVGEDVTINAIDGNGGYGVRNYEGAKFVMNGGKIATTYEDEDEPGNGYDATTLRVDAGAEAIINEGEINNISNYTFAIDNYGTVEVKGGTVTSVHSTVSNYGTLTINGGSFTCNGIEGITAHALVVWDRSQTTINGGVFDGKDNYNGFNVDANKGANVLIKGGEFRKVHSGSLYGEGTITVQGGKFFDKVPASRLAEGYVVLEVNEGEETFYVVGGQNSSISIKNGAVLDLKGDEYKGKIIAEGDLTIIGDTKIKTLQATNGGTITIEDGKTLTLNDFSFGSKNTAGNKYEIKGGTVVANYGFFQHGTYTLRSDFETGYMYYSYGSDITVYGTFHSQGKGDGLDYVRGKLTIAKGGKSIHDKSLWVGQPASWGAMNASLIIEEDGYLQANSLSVYEGSSLKYYNDKDLKYNTVLGTEYITKAQ